MRPHEACGIHCTRPAPIVAGLLTEGNSRINHDAEVEAIATLSGVWGHVEITVNNREAMKIRANMSKQRNGTTRSEREAPH